MCIRNENAIYNIVPYHTITPHCVTMSANGHFYSSYSIFFFCHYSLDLPSFIYYYFFFCSAFSSNNTTLSFNHLKHISQTDKLTSMNYLSVRSIFSCNTSLLCSPLLFLRLHHLQYSNFNYLFLLEQIVVDKTITKKKKKLRSLRTRK